MWKWFRNWRHSAEEDKELSEELEAHLAIEARQRMESGEAAEDAEWKARRAFGNVTHVLEDSRATWGIGSLTRFVEDAKLGWRMLRKTPGWTAVVCATLALGIGLTTAMFSLLHGVLLQPLPYKEPSQLVALWPSSPKSGYPRFNVNADLFLQWHRYARLFEDIALTRPIANFNLTGDGPPERLQGARTWANLPDVLGVKPLLGRVFTEEERQRDAKVAILSHGLWTRRFGADSKILGARIQLNGTPYEVIGVMPASYRYPSRDFELWTPLYIPPDEVRAGGNFQYIAVGRLKPGNTIEQAKAEMTSLMERLARERPNLYGIGIDSMQVLIEPLAESNASQVKDTLYALLASAACLLLIGCMNLGVLLLARASARAREMAMRTALGASRWRLRCQLLAELIPLGALGATGGVLTAWWTLRALIPFLPPNTPRLDEIGLHPAVLVFAMAASFLVVLIAGLLPAQTASREEPAGALRQSSRTVAGGGGARNVLVVAQIAVTLVLVFAGALFGRSLQALLQVNPGFSTQGVLTMHFAATRARYNSDPQVSDYYDRILQRIQSIPGVTAAGIVNRLPLSGVGQTGGVQFEGHEGVFDADWRSATPGYFPAMAIPLEQGRFFADSDRPTSQRVGLIDAQMARKVFGSQDPIGKRFRIAGDSGPWSEIVGVVGHIRNDSPDKDVRSQVYWPESQRTQDRGVLVVRTAGNAASFAPAVIEQIRLEDADQPVFDVRSMEQWLDRALQSRNLLTGMVGLFAGASLVLACLGLYGVVSYNAALRLREFGIRLALGADAGDVRRLVLRHAATLAVGGSILGIVLAWPAGRALRSFLFGVTPGDAASWIVAPVLLITVGILAGLWPARKAARTDPATTLRQD